MRLNNIYSSGDYFFLDFSVENKTHIPFDIDQIRLKLTDKKTAKVTNSQWWSCTLCSRWRRPSDSAMVIEM